MYITNEERYERYFWTLNKWIFLKTHEIDLFKHPQLRNFGSLALYGMGEIGKRIYEELESSGRKINFLVDKNGDALFADIPIYTGMEALPQVDVIIVSMICEFQEIEEHLKRVYLGPILSFEKVVNDLWEEYWIRDDNYYRTSV